MKNKRKAFYIVDHMVYNGKPIKWYYTTCGSWSDDKHRAKRFNEETANVMLIEYFNIPAFPVDTHVSRVTKRLGLCAENMNVTQNLVIHHLN